MKVHSLYTKIKLIFFVLFLLLTALFVAAFFISKAHDMMQTHKRYIGVAKMIVKQHRQGGGMPYEWVLENNHLVQIKEKPFKKEVIQNAEELGKQKVALPMPRFKLLRYEERHFIFIKRKHFKILLEDTNFPEPPYHLLFWYLFALGLVVLFYFWMTKSLKPLKELQQEIQKVAEGDLSISLRREDKDEIAQVANEFDNALRKIEALMSSRQLFMRTIMHELKTPIAKGMLLNEFLESERQKEQYDLVFERLELLIKEFSKIEQMLSSSYELKLNNYNVQEMVDQALELMILDVEKIEEKVELIVLETFVLNTDFELFSLALKNLIDNALKYSTNKKVSIKIYADKIEISNKGEAFMENLAEYAEPFNSKGNGLGLGLYIVQNIMKMLKLKIDYEFVGGRHLFMVFEKIERFQG